MLLAIARAMSRSEAISAFGYDAEDVDREIAADNQRRRPGLIFDSDPRYVEGRRQRGTQPQRRRRIRQQFDCLKDFP